MPAPPTTTPAERLIRQRLRALNRMLPAARRGDVTGVHQARVATRRLREALPLVAAGTPARKLERIVRRLTRALGPVRELDVALLMLDELGAGRGAPRAGIACLRQTIREERWRLLKDLLQSIDDRDLETLERRALKAARRGDPPPAARRRDPARLHAADARAARRGGRLRAAIDAAAGLYLPDRLHEARIAVKKLRYAMEIARELRGSRATARIQALKRAQDLLGRMHDLEVLIARIRAVQSSARAPDLRVSGELDRLVRQLETECRQLHGRYMTMRPALLAICDHVTALPPRRRRGASAA